MTNREIYDLLLKIDQGYKPTRSEKKDLELVDSIRWRNIDYLPNCIGLLSTLKKLDLGYTNVSDLYVLRRLKTLTYLNLTRTKVNDLSSLKGLRALTDLDLAGTDVSDISALSGLTALKKLGLDRTNVTDISMLSGLKALEVLSLTLARVSDLSALSGLTNLTNLYLSRTKVSDISALSGLRALKHLYLTGTKVSDIRALSGLTFLTNLNLGKTYVRNINALSRLTALKKLNLHLTQVSDISGLSGLAALTDLNLSETQVSDISGLSGLKSLTNLNLNRTNVSDISPLSRLPFLANLYLAYTKVNDISTLRGLKSLTNIDLRYLNLNAIPVWMINLGLDFLPEYQLEKSGIQIEGLKLKEQPIEVFGQNNELIRAYFREKIKVPVNECKVIFLGDAESGKTHSIRRLLRKGNYLTDFKGDSTPGIEINVSSTRLEGSDIIVNYWDFGGQEIQHSMHRMFLTERTLYVVFLNARQDPLDERARYWLENIKSYAPEAPVLLVINKTDQNKYPKINEKGLVNKYENQIKKVVRMSALEDEPEEFMENLQRSIDDVIKEMPSVKKEIPWSWKSLMEDIRTMSNHYLTTDGFIERCVANKVQDYEKIHDEIVNLFQEIGVSFCYHKDRALSDYMLLSPEWLLNALYTIVTNSKQVAINGVITKKVLYDLLTGDTINGVQIKRVLPKLRYKSYEVNYILGVTHMFRLSYSLRDGSEFFPMLCDGDEKILRQEAVDEDALHFIFRYRFLPSNVIHRLIVEMQRDLNEKYVWMTGAVFRNEEQEQTAYVHSSGNDLHIFVSGQGTFYNPNEYLSPISNCVRNINKDMGLSAEEYVTYREGDIETEIQYKTVKGSISHGVFQVYDPNLDKVIDYRDVARRYQNIRPNRYFDERPKTDTILRSVVFALKEMQSKKIYYSCDEDSRNSFVSSHLTAQLKGTGYTCADQQTGGIGLTGKAPGERDFVVKDEIGQDILIYEGLNLKTLDKTYIDKHIKKVLDNYNPQGLLYSILVTYIECNPEKFNSFIGKYRDHIAEYAPGTYSCVGKPIDVRFEGEFLRCMKMEYEVGGIKFFIYHIIVKIGL